MVEEPEAGAGGSASEPGPSPDGPGGRGTDDPGGRTRPPGPLESLFQEAVRRATGIGVTGLAATEEAVRKAFGESAPREWMDFLSAQGDGLRGEIVERIATEFREYLRSDDVEKTLRRVLDDYEISVNVRLRADAKPPSEPARVDVRRRED